LEEKGVTGNRKMGERESNPQQEEERKKELSRKAVTGRVFREMGP